MATKTSTATSTPEFDTAYATTLATDNLSVINETMQNYFSGMSKIFSVASETAIENINKMTELSTKTPSYLNPQEIPNKVKEIFSDSLKSTVEQGKLVKDTIDATLKPVKSRLENLSKDFKIS